MASELDTEEFFSICYKRLCPQIILSHFQEKSSGKIRQNISQCSHHIDAPTWKTHKQNLKLKKHLNWSQSVHIL